MTRQRAVGVAAALALSAAGVVAAAPAIAAPEPAQEVEVTSASLQWGVKESFRNYITGPIADGQIALQGSTTQTEDGTF
ncbi:MAG TPA: HtaA domain-containing protein, partial [Candidatus Ruania gallistercoris]|nr:HtaA domain-containing protein [Candidatus Ruania gallistercoris]